MSHRWKKRTHDYEDERRAVLHVLQTPSLIKIRVVEEKNNLKISANFGKFMQPSVTAPTRKNTCLTTIALFLTFALSR